MGVATLASAPTGASAGTYTVQSCESAPSRTAVGGWDAHNVQGMDADRDCPRNGDLLRGLAVFNRSNVGRLSQGATSSVSFRAPAGTSLVGMDYTWDGYRTDADWTIGLTAGDALLDGCQANVGDRCHLGRDGTEERHVDLADRSLVTLEATCGARDGCWTSATGDDAQRNRRARVQLIGTEITIEDPSDPGVADVSGSLWEDGWIRGTREAEFTASDNTGISATRVLVDGVEHDIRTHECSYARPVPCSSVGEGRRFALATSTLTDGAHSVVMEAEDAASNSGRVSRTIAVDNNGPTGYFEPASSEDRTRVAVALSDLASGVDSGSMEMRRSGTAEWRPVASSLDGDHLVGRLPSSGVEAGVYEFRALVTDRAGNSRVVDTTENGSRAQFTVPASSSLTAGLISRSGELVASRTVRRGNTAQAEGRLRDADGPPLPGRSIAVEARTLVSGAEWHDEGRTTTDNDGRFAYRVPSGPGRNLRFRFAGSETHLPSEDAVRVEVPAEASLDAGKRKVPSGGRVRFVGDIRGGPMPRGGKLVNLQAYYRDKWRTFALPRTNADGRWSYRYRFGASTRRTVYRFRALVPREDGYPYRPGRSRTVSVIVKGD